MNITEEEQIKSKHYYDKFSKIYDWISFDSYYRKPRKFAIEKLNLKPNQTVLNIPCGTGQNFKYFEQYLKNTGQIIGIDLSEGMLTEAENKTKKNDWKNIKHFCADARKINHNWINKNVGQGLKFDSILCDLGLSGFPEWQNIIDNLISLLKPNGKLVIMDWYIEKSSLRGKFIKWIGKGEVNRPLHQYMESKVANFELTNTFKNGEMFVATGTKKKESLHTTKYKNNKD